MAPDMPMTRWMLVAGLLALCACSGQARRAEVARIDPDVARARIEALLPANLDNRAGWAVDIFAAFETLDIAPTDEHFCAVVAVGEQETGLRVDPTVTGLPAIARREIEARAESHNVPKLLLRAALALPSPDGRSFSERIDAARTEKALSTLFEDFIDMVPLGRRLFADWNPVHTAGPMQVSIAFAERHAKERRYPYPLSGSVRSEVFTRRGGLYFGIAHLLDYPASYDSPLYRFADFNAGHYASRNAAFQSAVAGLTGRPLALDGDLLIAGGAASDASRTELAVRQLAEQLGMNDVQIRADLAKGDSVEFESSRLFLRTFELADASRRQRPPRALVPAIKLKSPKITRSLTTEWFARRVEDRYRRCLVRKGP
jgi:hypothetical protein